MYWSTVLKLLSYAFDLAGNLQAMRYGNGVTNLYQYDSLNRLTNAAWKLNASTLASFYYQLGLTGNRTNLIENVNNTARTNQWQYDPLYRLTNELIKTTITATLGYGYDAVGNRTNRVVSNVGLTNQSFSYTTNDWLTSDSYDSNGNTTNSGTSAYHYDVLNHLTNLNNSVYITYNGDGDRMSKTVGGTTNYYLVDDRNLSGYAQVVEEYQGSNLIKIYNYGLNLISQRVPGTSTNYFVYDGQGSTRLLADAGGNVANTFTYDAYGNLIASNATPQAAYLYCGQQFDPDLGQLYNRARYLNLNIGRFWTMDTFAGNNQDPVSLHRYQYCKDNPINEVDPSGLVSYVCFDTVGWSDFGHVGLITHNPKTGVYARFDYAHGHEAERFSFNAKSLFRGYGILFIIPDKYDLVLNKARQNFVPKPGDSTMENNCLTSVQAIFDAAKVPFPGEGSLYPNMWLSAFWNANYGYILVENRAANWIQKTLIRGDTLGIGFVPGTGAMYVEF